MPSLGMTGPFALTGEVICAFVTKRSPGNYALGYTNKDGCFCIQRVGRSDDDVNGRLQQCIGESKQFKFSFAASAKEAFEKECRNYHDFNKPTGNKIHPERPEGAEYNCPVEDCQELKLLPVLQRVRDYESLKNAGERIATDVAAEARPSLVDVPPQGSQGSPDRH
jgi:hypothetical protein